MSYPGGHCKHGCPQEPSPLASKNWWQVKPQNDSADLEQSGHQTTRTVQPAIQTLLFNVFQLRPTLRFKKCNYLYDLKGKKKIYIYTNKAPAFRRELPQRVTTSPGAWIVSSRRPARRFHRCESGNVAKWGMFHIATLNLHERNILA